MDVRTYQVSTKNSNVGSNSNSGGNNSYAPISHKHEASDIKESSDRVFLTRKEKDDLLDHLNNSCGSSNNNTNDNVNDDNKNRTYIYREGFESVNFSGEIISGGYNRGDGSIYKYVDYIDINCKGSNTCTRSITHNETIDLTNFKKIKIDYLLNDALQSNKNVGLRLSSRKDSFSDHTIFDSYYANERLSLLGSKGRVEAEMDISGVSGPYYIHVGVDQWDRTNREFRLFIKNIWLE